MEDVPDLYAEPYDAQRPQVCLDEASYQWLEDVHKPLPTAPSQPRKQDAECVRRGTCNLFVAVEAQAGRRHVAVTAQRTAQVFAHFLGDLVEVQHPDAPAIRLVTDTLSTHSPAALYETFDAATTQRLTRKLEWHSTPKHASWLSMAEIEIGVLKRQCIGRRIAAQDELAREVNAWQAQRNQQPATITWTFTTQAARTKLARDYELASL